MVGQSVSKSWCRAPSGAHDQIFITVWQLRSCFLWGALSGMRTGLSFVHAVGPCQRNLFRVQVPWDSWPYFTVSDLKLPFSSPPTARRVTVKVFNPASRWVTGLSLNVSWSLSWSLARTTQKTPLSITPPSLCVSLAVITWWLLNHCLAIGMFAELFPSNSGFSVSCFEQICHIMDVLYSASLICECVFVLALLETEYIF
jgi:hypothetical protein